MMYIEGLSISNVPKQQEINMKKLFPYLTFAGNCREALDFYKNALNGEIVSINTFSETNMPVDDSQKNRIVHAEFKSEDIYFAASDGMPDFKGVPGNMVTLSINLDDLQEQERIFKALSAGGTVSMPLQKTFWGAMYGQLIDRYGIQWMLNCELRS